MARLPQPPAVAVPVDVVPVDVVPVDVVPLEEKQERLACRGDLAVVADDPVPGDVEVRVEPQETA